MLFWANQHDVGLKSPRRRKDWRNPKRTQEYGQAQSCGAQGGDAFDPESIFEDLFPRRVSRFIPTHQKQIVSGRHEGSGDFLDADIPGIVSVEDL